MLIVFKHTYIILKALKCSIMHKKKNKVKENYEENLIKLNEFEVVKKAEKKIINNNVLR